MKVDTSLWSEEARDAFVEGWEDAGGTMDDLESSTPWCCPIPPRRPTTTQRSCSAAVRSLQKPAHGFLIRTSPNLASRCKMAPSI